MRWCKAEMSGSCGCFSLCLVSISRQKFERQKLSYPISSSAFPLWFQYWRDPMRFSPFSHLNSAAFPAVGARSLTKDGSSGPCSERAGNGRKLSGALAAAWGRKTCITWGKYACLCRKHLFLCILWDVPCLEWQEGCWETPDGLCVCMCVFVFFRPHGDRFRSRVELVSVLNGILDLTTFDYKTGQFWDIKLPPIRIRTRKVSLMSWLLGRLSLTCRLIQKWFWFTIPLL